jgi:hypothetical protein
MVMTSTAPCTVVKSRCSIESTTSRPRLGDDEAAEEARYLEPARRHERDQRVPDGVAHHDDPPGQTLG